MKDVANADLNSTELGMSSNANIVKQRYTLDKSARAAALGQKPSCVWLTGLSGAGKSTIANRIDEKLHSIGKHSYVLDGDNVRHGLNSDLGFSISDRAENVRRVGEVAKLMVDSGLVVIVALISPVRSERLHVRSMFAEGEFFEVYLDTPIAVCEQRDPKGLYVKARAGKLPNFTGISSTYEAPLAPEFRFDTSVNGADDVASIVCSRLLA